MSEIEVGEYVRTYEGFIGILKQINKENYNYLTIDVQNEVRRDGYHPLNYLYLKNEDIRKYSKNIIDLIEVGDIVNNHYVKAVCLDGAVKYIKLDNAYSPENHFTGVRTYEEDIETILTHEQYEHYCYKIERS